MSQIDTKPNGQQQPRRPLSEQLDRLDAILDALDAGLAVVVADAVHRAAGEAARQTADAVAREMLNNPDARADQAIAATWLPPLAAGARWVCRFAWRHRVASGVSLSAGVAVFVASYLCGPTASSLALGAIGAAVASRPSRLWAWLTVREGCRPQVDDRTADEILTEGTHPEVRLPEGQGAE